MDNEKRLEVIREVDNNASLKKNIIIFEISKIKVEYRIEKRKFFVDKDYFGKIPHVMKDGSICLYGSIEICLNDLNEESSLKSIVSTYIPWLFNLPLKLKLLEFIFEIEFYISNYLGYRTAEKTLRKNKIYKKIKIGLVSQLWETIEEMESFCIYQIYIENYEDYAIFLQKENRTIIYERDTYKKARQRVTGAKCNNITGKTAFIGVGSVNSYIIKYCLANGLNDLILVDHDKYTKDNAFKFAFPYKGKKKIYAVNEFCKNLENINLKFYNTNINAKSNKEIVNDCKRVIVSVDNFFSWKDIANYLSNSCLDSNIEIIFAAINNFGENAKFVKTNPQKVQKVIDDFLFNSKTKCRREMIGNGCGKSIAIYDEEILIKLAKNVVKAIVEKEKEDEIIYVDI